MKVFGGPLTNVGLVITPLALPPILKPDYGSHTRIHYQRGPQNPGREDLTHTQMTRQSAHLH